MTAPETPSPSPLTPEERQSAKEGAAEVLALADEFPPTGEVSRTIRNQAETVSRLLAERDSLAARVSHLEARLERAGQRVIDAIPRQCTNEPDMHGDWCRNLGHAAPVPEDKKESAP